MNNPRYYFYLHVKRNNERERDNASTINSIKFMLNKSKHINKIISVF